MRMLGSLQRNMRKFGWAPTLGANDSPLAKQNKYRFATGNGMNLLLLKNHCLLHSKFSVLFYFSTKEAFRKIRHKQNMWRVYKHTGKDKDYVVYKEALNAATNEVRKSKRNFELKVAQNKKSDSKSFYAYVRSKQNVRDKVGPLEDNAGDKITEGILMAEELNMHFSSVFTREDTSSLPVPETKFNGSEEERLGQLIVTPEVVASKINNMKENKSPGVDGLSPKILKETVEQISKPLAHVFNMSLQEGIVPLEWKEANIIPLFKKGSRNKSVNYRPVSLT